MNANVYPFLSADVSKIHEVNEIPVAQGRIMVTYFKPKAAIKLNNHDFKWLYTALHYPNSPFLNVNA